MIYEVTIEAKTYRVELVRHSSGWSCKLDGHAFPFDVTSLENGLLSVLVEGKSYEVRQEVAGSETSVVVGHERYKTTVRDPRSLRARIRGDDHAQGPQR